MNLKLLIFMAAAAALNILSFALMMADKRRAVQRRRRVSERTLFISAACFGALGGTLAMWIGRHKYRKWYFRAFFPSMMMIQAVAAGLMQGSGGKFNPKGLATREEVAQVMMNLIRTYLQ